MSSSIKITKNSVNEQISQGIIDKQDSFFRYPLSENCKSVDLPESYKSMSSTDEHINVEDIAISTAGNIYLLEYSGIYNEPRDNYISVITKEGDYIPKWLNPDFFIHAIALDNDNTLYLFGNENTVNERDLIYRVNDQKVSELFYLFGNETISFSSGLFTHTTEILFDRNNILYLPDNPFTNEDEYGNVYNDIKVIGQRGELMSEYKKVGQLVMDMKFDSLGNLYTLNNGDTDGGYVSISRITPEHKVISEWVRTDRGTNLVIDAENNLYTAFANAHDKYKGERNKIYKISMNSSIKKSDLDLPGKESKPDTSTYLFIDKKNELYAFGGPLVGLYQIDKIDLNITGLIWKPAKGYMGRVYPFVMHNNTYFMIVESSIYGETKSTYKWIEC